MRYRAVLRTRELDRVKLVERDRLARDLHDTVAHHVSAIAIRAQAGLATAVTQPDAATDALRLIEAEASRALTEMHRAMRPGGSLLVSFHGGVGELRRDEWYGKPVAIGVTLFEVEEMSGYMAAAGFEVERVAEREPYEFEYPTRRLYAFGRKPAGAK